MELMGIWMWRIPKTCDVSAKVIINLLKIFQAIHGHKSLHALNIHSNYEIILHCENIANLHWPKYINSKEGRIILLYLPLNAFKKYENFLMAWFKDGPRPYYTLSWNWYFLTNNICNEIVVGNCHSFDFVIVFLESNAWTKLWCHYQRYI